MPSGSDPDPASQSKLFEPSPRYELEPLRFRVLRWVILVAGVLNAALLVLSIDTEGAPEAGTNGDDGSALSGEFTAPGWVLVVNALSWLVCVLIVVPRWNPRSTR